MQMGLGNGDRFCSSWQSGLRVSFCCPSDFGLGYLTRKVAKSSVYWSGSRSTSVSAGSSYCVREDNGGMMVMASV